MFSRLLFLSFSLMVFSQTIFAQRDIKAIVIDQQGTYWNQIKAYLYLEEPGSTIKNLVDSTEILDGNLEFKNVVITSVSDIIDFNDFSNYPNPFNQTTNFVYFSNGTDPVTITIYDMFGRVVDRVENGIKPKGKNSLTWSGRNLNNGIYIAECRNGQNAKAIRILKNKNSSSFSGNMALKSARNPVLEQTNAWIEIRGEEAFPYTLGFDNSTEGEINLGDIIVNRKGILNELDTIGSLTTLFNLHKDAAVVYSDTLSATADTLRALYSLGQWLVRQPEVEEAYYVGLNLIEVYLTNGLRTDILLIPVDEDGQHLIRGGGTESSGLKKFSALAETKKIDNPGVLVLIPFIEEFYGGSWNKEAQFKGGSPNAPQPSDVTVITGTDVTLPELERMDSAGLIILNTHGTEDGFQLRLKDNGFNLADTSRFNKHDIRYFILSKNEVPLDKLVSGELRISVQYDRDFFSKGIVGIESHLTVTEKYVRNMNIDLSGSVLFANHCYSGWVGDGNTKNNMSQAWLSKGLSTYYGYAYENGFSAVVDNDFCRKMEDSLIVNLVQKVDTTGEAHLKPDGSIHFELQTKRIKRSKVKKVATLSEMNSSDLPYERVNVPLYFVQYFEDNYQYKDCGENLVDGRDGTIYKTVCIGDQVWMAENLKWAGAGVCYDSSSGNCDVFGRLYTILEATGAKSPSPGSNVQGICPEGWHIPSEAEVQELLDFVGGSAIAGDMLKADTLWTGSYTDPFGFAALPAGWWRDDYSSITPGFNDIGTNTAFWTSTVYYDEFYVLLSLVHDLSKGKINSTKIEDPATDIPFKLSCRCVKDK